MGTILSIIFVYCGASMVWKHGKSLYEKHLKGKVKSITTKTKKK